MGQAAIEAAPAPQAVEEEFAGNKRLLGGWQAALATLLCIGFTLFHLFVLNV